jgi:hypothetical protein
MPISIPLTFSLNPALLLGLFRKIPELSGTGRPLFHQTIKDKIYAQADNEYRGQRLDII